MTEAEWLACTEPQSMLEFVRGKVSDRKLRLFACACRRRIAHLLPHDSDREAIEEVERYVDQEGGISQLEKKEAETSPYFFSCYVVCYWNPDDPHERYVVDASRAFNAAVAAAWDSASAAGEVFFAESKTYGYDPDAEQLERTIQARLLRCIVGNPFRHVPVDKGWLAWSDSIVVKMAQGIYADRVFDRLPILADALEEAGCTNADILAHCRLPGEHVRGCWVVDLILGKE